MGDRRRYTLVGLCAAAVVVVATAGVLGFRVLRPDSGTIPPGVTIQGLPVGGLDEGEATRLVQANAPTPQRVMRFASAGAPDFALEVPLAALDPVAEVPRAVRQALRQPSFLERLKVQVGLDASPREIPLTYHLAPAALERVATLVSQGLDRPARSASLRVADGTIALTRSRPGREVDQAVLRRLVRRLPGRVQVPVTPLPPAVADAAASEARRRALLVVSGPATVTAPGARAALRRDTLLGALRFRESGARIVTTIDAETITPALRQGLASTVRQARSAGFQVVGDGVRVTPSQDGRVPDAARVARLLVSRPGQRTIRAPFIVSKPDRTTAQARAMRIREMISEFTTPYACCPPRVTNIQLAARILDGTVIPPGGTFSLNDELGERTIARGFVAAPQINAGMLEDAVGGGVSQIATTLYNAAFFGGLELVSHTPHEFYIGRYPPGREATVSWGGPELIFRNDWDAGVLIDAEATDTSVTFRFFSSRLGRRVTTSSGDAGAPGAAFSISYTRKVFQGEAVKRDETYSWTYKTEPAG